jgi:hypothetical protein
MDGIVVFFRKWATLPNALISLAAFGLNALVLQFLDSPLMALANGEPKPDLRFGYDLATMRMLFDAYGDQGRVIYIWNLVADMFLPIFGAIAGVLWVLLVVRSAAWQKALILPPLIFGVTDLIENGLLFALVSGYPDLPAGLVAFTSIVTQVKRSAYYLTAATVIVCVVVLVVTKVRQRQVSA